jgi:hypothetical protein
VDGSLGFLNELIGSSSDDDSAGFGIGASGEEIEAFGADLNFLELAADSEGILADVVAGVVEYGSSGFGDAFQVVIGDTAGAENISVSEVLGGQISDGQFA